MSSRPKLQLEGAAVPARPTVQTTLSAAPNRQKSRRPLATLPGGAGRAVRCAVPLALGLVDW
eukprot:15182804-Alexandrium_andersonii.AAC.1